MDKTVFVANEPGVWWLVTPDYYVIEEPRKELGQALGFSDLQWYLQPERLDGLYRQLEASHYQLLTDLDEAHDDVKRIEWLAAVTKVFTPDGAEAHPQPSSSPADLADTRPGTAGPPSAPSRPSPFAKKAASVEAEPAPPSADGPDAAEVADGAPTAEPPSAPSRPSPFAKKAASVEAEPAPPPAQAAEGSEASLEAAVKDVVADLASSSELAGDLGVSEAELQDLLNDLPADFESRVAAEAARLAAQG